MTDERRPFPLEITDRDRALAAAMAVVPDRAGIRRLLEDYFVGPISDEAVDQIEAGFLEIYNDDARWATYSREFESPTLWQGKAWNEEFTIHRSWMTPRDLVLLLANICANREDGFPAPKLHCPAEVVGTWEQLEPAPPSGERIVWHLGADGSYRSNNPDIPPTKKVWCVEESFGGRFFLSLGDAPTRGCSWTYGVTLVDGDIVGVYLTSGRGIPFRLRRHQPASKR